MSDKSGLLFKSNYIDKDWYMRVFFSISTIVIALLSTNYHAWAQQKNTIIRHEKPHRLACPSQEFTTFFEIFSNNVDIQQSFTRIPLNEQYLDNSQDYSEPVMIKKKLKFNEIQFPIIPLQEQRATALLNIRINYVRRNKAHISLYKEDTCYLVDYSFIRHQGCWRLVSTAYWGL